MGNPRQGAFDIIAPEGSSIERGSKKKATLLNGLESLMSPILERHQNGAGRIRSHLLSSLVGLGRSTVTGMLCTSGSSHQDWSSDYRLYSKVRLESDVLFGEIRQEVERGRAAGDTVVIALDDTLLGKTGRKVAGARYRRDPQGPPFGCNLTWSQRFIQCSAAVGNNPATTRMVPVDLAHAPGARKPGKHATEEEKIFYRQEQKRLKLTQVGVERLNHLARVWDEQNRLIVTVDGGYSNQTFFRQRHERLTVVGRIRKDAQLYFAPKNPLGIGRKKVYGDLVPTPEELRQNPDIAYEQVEAYACGKKHSFKIKTLAGLRTRMDGGRQEYRLVVIAPLGYRPRKSSRLLYRKPAYLLCSDPTLDIQQILQSYIWRWEIEVNFRDQKTLIGIGDGQVRNQNSVELLPQLQTAAYSLLLLAAEQTTKEAVSLPLPKWRKSVPPQRPTTTMLLNQLRHDLWATQIHPRHFSGFASNASQNANQEKYTFNLPSALFTAAG